jgi:hypothetical protein
MDCPDGGPDGGGVALRGVIIRKHRRFAARAWLVRIGPDIAGLRLRPQVRIRGGFRVSSAGLPQMPDAARLRGIRYILCVFRATTPTLGRKVGGLCNHREICANKTPCRAWLMWALSTGWKQGQPRLRQFTRMRHAGPFWPCKYPCPMLAYTQYEGRVSRRQRGRKRLTGARQGA